MKTKSMMDYMKSRNAMQLRDGEDPVKKTKPKQMPEAEVKARKEAYLKKFGKPYSSGPVPAVQEAAPTTFKDTAEKEAWFAKRPNRKK